LFPLDKGIEGSFKNEDNGMMVKLVDIVEKEQWLCSQVHRLRLLSSYDEMFPWDEPSLILHFL